MQLHPIINYIREQFRHHRFFTFLHLFGTTITVMIATMIIMDLDNHVHPGGPEENTAQLRYITVMNLKQTHSNNTKTGGVTLPIAQKIAQRVHEVDHVAFSTTKNWTLPKDYSVYGLALRYTNSKFWNVFSFEFIEGNGYTQQEVESGEKKAVISKKLRDILFPGQKQVIGKTASINDESCTIIGVVENVSATCNQTHADAWLPFTLHDRQATSGMVNEPGTYSLSFLLSANSSENILQQEVNNLQAEINQTKKEWKIQLAPIGDSWSAHFRDPRGVGNYEGKFNELLTLFSRILLIMLIPAINLISLNITRMHERSEEIAIRKTYGASNTRLLNQLLVEQGGLTIVGGILGFLFAIVTFLFYKNEILFSTGSFEHIEVSFRISFLPIIGSLLVVFLLNIMGGFIPALKITKIQPAKALKGDLS